MCVTQLSAGTICGRHNRIALISSSIQSNYFTCTYQKLFSKLIPKSTHQNRICKSSQFNCFLHTFAAGILRQTENPSFCYVRCDKWRSRKCNTFRYDRISIGFSEEKIPAVDLLWNWKLYYRFCAKIFRIIHEPHLIPVFVSNINRKLQFPCTGSDYNTFMKCLNSFNWFPSIPGMISHYFLKCKCQFTNAKAGKCRHARKLIAANLNGELCERFAR